MVNRFLEPLLTTEFDSRNFKLPDGCTYIFGDISGEERCEASSDWIAAARDITSIQILTESPDAVTISAPKLGFADEVVDLRDGGAIIDMMMKHSSPAYLDITGLAHNTWAPLLKAAISQNVNITVMYLEPLRYEVSPLPSTGMVFDLSESIQEIAPITGFATLRTRAFVNAILVPVLGFEGTRLGHVLGQVEPPALRVVPILGVPGFRAEYPFYSYEGNRVQLEADFLHSRIRFAKANCPFDAFMTIDDIAHDYDRPPLKLAPLGTRPHSVACVLYAIACPGRVEILYDHPIRRSDRTAGQARVCVYDVASFVQSDIFLAVANYA